MSDEHMDDDVIDYAERGRWHPGDYTVTDKKPTGPPQEQRPEAEQPKGDQHHGPEARREGVPGGAGA